MVYFFYTFIYKYNIIIIIIKKEVDNFLEEITPKNIQTVFEFLCKKIEIISNEKLENKKNVLESICLLRKNIISVFIENKDISKLTILIKHGLLSYAEILCNKSLFFFFFIFLYN